MIAFEASDENFLSDHGAILDFLEPSQFSFEISWAQKMLEACSQINSCDAKIFDRKEKY